MSESQDFQTRVATLREAVGRVIVGQRAVVDEVLVCLFAGGHVLLEGAPGDRRPWHRCRCHDVRVMQRIGKPTV